MNHRKALFTYALGLTHSREAAEDVVQLVIYRLLQKQRLPKSLRPYAFRAVRNAAVDLARRDSFNGDRSSIFAGISEASPLDAIEQRDLLHALFEALSENERECIILKFFNGLTFSEIGEVLEVPAATSASWYRRGLEKMRKHMEHVMP